jgi:hypothetical protein
MLDNNGNRREERKRVYSHNAKRIEGDGNKLPDITKSYFDKPSSRGKM